MSFKDQITLDINQVFFNSDEFTETHLLHGATINCMISSNDIHGRSFNKVDEFNDGLIQYDVEVIYKWVDYPYRLANGERITFDDVPYLVFNFAVDSGVCILKLQGVIG